MQKTARKKKNSDYPLDIWERVEIVVEENDDVGIYVARIDDFNKDGIVITQPEWIKGSKFMISNAKVFVRFAKSDALYQFPAQTRRLAGKEAGNLQLFNIGSIRRLQRREFVRVDYVTKMTYTVLENMKNEKQKFNWLPSLTTNISAGGLLMKIDDRVETDHLLLLKITNYAELNIPRFVVAICRRILRNGEYLLAGVEFVVQENLHNYLKPEDLERLPVQVKKFNIQNQNKLVRFVFEEQIKERNKGLL